MSRSVRLEPGWYWYTIGRNDGGYASDQLRSLEAMRRLRVTRRAPGLWTVERPGEWHLLEVFRPLDFALFPHTFGPHPAPRGADTQPQDVGQEWERPDSLMDNIQDGASEAVARLPSAARGVTTILVAAGLAAILLSLRRTR